MQLRQWLNGAAKQAGSRPEGVVDVQAVWGTHRFATSPSLWLGVLASSLRLGETVNW